MGSAPIFRIAAALNDTGSPCLEISTWYAVGLSTGFVFSFGHLRRQHVQSREDLYWKPGFTRLPASWANPSTASTPKEAFAVRAARRLELPPPTRRIEMLMHSENITLGKSHAPPAYTPTKNLLRTVP